MRHVVFACIHNAGRSQMAAAWLERLAPPGTVCVRSAGTDPAARVHDEVLEVMREVGIELAGRRPARITSPMIAAATHLVTMGCGDVDVPVPAGVVRLDWPLPDPKGMARAGVRATRDAIRLHVQHLLDGWQLEDQRSLPASPDR